MTTKTKKVKAWVVLDEQGTFLRVALCKADSPNPFKRVFVPCTVAYTLPSKKKK